MAEQAYAYVTLIPVAKGFQRAVSNELSGLGAEGSAAGRKFQTGFAGALKGLAAPVAAAFSGIAIGGFVKDAVGQASNLAESINAVNVSFGAAANGIKELGTEAASQLGLSTQQFNQLAVGFTAFAEKIAGPGQDVVGVIDDLTTRGADFASVMNLEVNEALDIFRSGLAGETEPLRRFGIDVSEASVKAFAYANGIAEVGSELTEQEKIQARYGAIMEQTSRFAGDFANTSDGLANSQRILKATFADVQAEVGNALLPVLAELTTALIPVVEDLAPVLTQVFEALAPVITTLADNMGPLISAVQPLIEVFGIFMEVAAEILAQVLPPLIEVIEILAPVVLELVEAFMPLIDQVLPAAVDLIKALIPVIQNMATFISQYVVPVVTALSEIFGEGLAFTLGLATKMVQDLTSFLGPLAAGLKPIVDGLLGIAGIKPGDLQKTITINYKVDPGTTGEKNRFNNLAREAGLIVTPPKTPTPSPIPTPTPQSTKAADTLKKQTEELRKVIQATREAYKEARKDFFDAVADANEAYFEKTADIQSNYTEAIAQAEESFAERNSDIIERFNERIIDAEERLGKTRTEAIKRAAKETAKAQERFAEQTTNFQKDYDRDVAESNSKFAKRSADIQKTFDAESAKANATYAKRTADIQKTYDVAVSKANEAFADRSLDIQRAYQNSIAKAAQARDLGLASALTDYNNAVADINKKFAQRQADIIAQSLNRLRDAYRTAVQVNVANIFDSDQIAGSVKGLVVTLREKLLASRKLLENAAKLSTAGFSQTFIEQVVASGTDVGNELATSILNATPEMQAELKSLYGAIESESETGMDALAKTIFEKNGLATSELKSLYAQTEAELASSLANQRAIYEQAQAQILATFSASVAESEATRSAALAEAKADLSAALASAKSKFDEANAEAASDLAESLAASKKKLDEANAAALLALTEDLADAKTKFDEKNAEAKKDLDKSLADTQLELDEALADAQIAFDEALAEAEKARDKALLDSQEALDKNILSAKKKRDTALAEAQESLDKALVKANEKFLEDIGKIETQFNAKVASMKGAAQALATQIAGVQSALNQAQAKFGQSLPVAGDAGLIPFANGGLVTGPTRALIGEAGPEVVIPLDRFESMMGMTQGGKEFNYYAAPNQSLDSEQELFQAMKRAKVVVGW